MKQNQERESLSYYQRIPEQSRSEVKMKYELFKEIVLLKDIPEKKLKKGDVATIVEHHPSTTSEMDILWKFSMRLEIPWPL